MWDTGKYKFSNAHGSMSPWHRKEPLSHPQAWTKWSLIVLHNFAHYSGSPLTTWSTNRHEIESDWLSD